MELVLQLPLLLRARETKKRSNVVVFVSVAQSIKTTFCALPFSLEWSEK